jgi:hypothetical protein
MGLGITMKAVRQGGSVDWRTGTTECGCWQCRLPEDRSGRSGDEKSDKWVGLAQRYDVFILLFCIVFF